MDGWIEVCPLGEIPRRGARVVRRSGATPIALFRTATDRVFALLDRCPHRGGPLSQGLVVGDRVVCPLHGWTLELCDGQAVSPDEGCAQGFAVEVCDGRVLLRESDLVAGDVAPVSASPPVVPAQAGTQRLSILEDCATDAGFPPSRERQC